VTSSATSNMDWWFKRNPWSSRFPERSVEDGYAITRFNSDDLYAYLGLEGGIPDEDSAGVNREQNL
jgi:hypothetical protein